MVSPARIATRGVGAWDVVDVCDMNDICAHIHRRHLPCEANLRPSLRVVHSHCTRVSAYFLDMCSCLVPSHSNTEMLSAVLLCPVVLVLNECRVRRINEDHRGHWRTRLADDSSCFHIRPTIVTVFSGAWSLLQSWSRSQREHRQLHLP